MVGLLSSWTLELNYIIISFVLVLFTKSDRVREIAAVIKLLEFVLIPMVQIFTSQPILKYIKYGSSQE